MTVTAAYTKNLTVPIWDQTSHRWVRAAYLPAGHLLRTADGQALSVLKLITPKVTSGDMWDLTVANDHDFFVTAGQSTVLVHNCETPWLDEVGEAHSRPHFTGGAGKSVFKEGEQPYALVDESAGYEATPRADGRCERVCSTNRILGYDQSGLPTNFFTVIQEQWGRVVTLHPGFPD
jgi:hypothetical protein